MKEGEIEWGKEKRKRERERQRDSTEILKKGNHRRVHSPGKKIENDQESGNYW